MFDTSTLTTILSTNAQILGALIAIIATFVHFRILRLQDYLIGDDKAFFSSKNWEDNWNAIRKNHTVDNSIENLLHQRLEDAINRKSVNEIADVLRNLKRIAEKTEQSKDKNSLIYIINEWFNGTKKQINRLRNLTLVTVSFALFSLITSLFFLLQTYAVKTCVCYSLEHAIMSTSLTVISLILSGFVIYLGLAEDAIHEKDNDNPVDLSSVKKTL